MTTSARRSDRERVRSFRGARSHDALDPLPVAVSADRNPIAGLEQTQGHGLTHGADPDKPDCEGTHVRGIIRGITFVILPAVSVVRRLASVGCILSSSKDPERVEG